MVVGRKIPILRENFAKKLRKAKEDRVERRGKKEGKEDFRRDLSYRKTHRAVHSVSAFISFSRICRVIGFHLYTRCTLIFPAPTCTDFYPISKKRRTLISSFFSLLLFFSLSLFLSVLKFLFHRVYFALVIPRETGVRSLLHYFHINNVALRSEMTDVNKSRITGISSNEFHPVPRESK